MMLNGDENEDDLLIIPKGNLEIIFQAIYFKPIYILFRLESESSFVLEYHTVWNWVASRQPAAQ